MDVGVESWEARQRAGGHRRVLGARKKEGESELRGTGEREKAESIGESEKRGTREKNWGRRKDLGGRGVRETELNTPPHLHNFLSTHRSSYKW